MKPSELRRIPAVEKALRALDQVPLPRPVVVAVVRRELAALRKVRPIPAFDQVLARIQRALETLAQSRIQPVINGTGILVHTNLGRAPLGARVAEALQTIASRYNNLEFDLGTGGRGGRAAALELNLAVLCGAGAAIVTNNCAAALVLILRHFTAGQHKRVIISRGELVQIGGGFRIPEILEASGAHLHEIGTTNQTSVADYRRAIDRETALVLKVHRSNFFMGGFVDSPPTAAIADVARRKRIPFVEDLGSGAVLSTDALAPVEHEPTPAEVLRQGADLVCFSGDKLLGGPQSGIIVGKSRLVAALKRDPFFRALRCDKLILSALQTVTEDYLNGTAAGSLPVLAMMQVKPGELRSRAEHIVAALAGLPVNARIGTATARLGGGTLPHSEIPSVTVDLLPDCVSLPEFAARLRNPQAGAPVIGYLSGGRYRLDLRTVFPSEDEELMRKIRCGLGEARPAAATKSS